MLINYIKTAYRNMLRNLSQTIINILGLAIGMTCALLIFLWVQNQVNYDKWQEKGDRIYRLEYNDWVIMPPYIADIINDLPEVEDISRLYFWHEPTLTYKETAYNIPDFLIADSSIFNIFNFNFLNGTPEEALKNPFSIVLTKTISKNLFADENPIGKEILMDNEDVYTVTGVISDVKNLHLSINAIMAVQDVAKSNGNNNFLESRNHNFLIYLLLASNVNKDITVEKINNLIYDNFQKDQSQYLLLRPFKNIYFTRGLFHESGVKHGNYSLILIFSAISILILLIACINFINITTAKANLRVKEIAIRKIVGAQRKTIAYQFLGETIFMVIIAHIISVALLEFILPKFNLITNENIIFNYLSSDFIIIVFAIIIVTTFLSGIYPSLYLSSLKPVSILKGKSNQKSNGNLRKALMITQFIISIFLIITTITILKQLNFVLNKDLGWNQENIVTFRIRGDKFNGDFENVIIGKDAFNTELLKNPNIINVTYLNQYPGSITNTWTWTMEGTDFPMKIINTDPEFIKTLNLKLIAGRNFSYESQGDINDKMIINEAAVKYLGLENPVGTILTEERGIEIIGVVKNFNFNSLHSKVEPMALQWYPRTSGVNLKISNTNIPQTIKYVKSIHQEFCPNYPFEYSFMDEEFAKQYENEMKQSKILIFFACIAIFIAGLGLFGMSSFISATRVKEIGIRKALGSSISEILILFSKDFIRWILIAFVIASPLAYYLVKRWLMQYPYKTNIDWWVFAAALVITILVALCTIGYQVIKAARTNPIDCLRYE